MKTLFLENKIPYDGQQLHSLHAYLNYHLLGDSAVAWIGPCSIPFEHMVDGEDLLAEAIIAGDEMLHFIIERFHTSLFAGVTLQRLFAAICLDLLRELVGPEKGIRLRRSGDDIYFGESKFSISIATLSPVSTLIHFAMNCTNHGTPVATAAFSDFNLDASTFAKEALSRLAAEVETIVEATMKVRPVS
jgi:hypothetical protein